MLASIIIILLMGSINNVQLCHGTSRSDQSHEQHSRHGQAAANKPVSVIIIGAGMSGKNCIIAQIDRSLLYDQSPTSIA
jgi:hypothetical protein